MFVILKIILLLFRPIIWIALLALIALLTKNAVRKKRLFSLAFILLIVFSNPFIVNHITAAYEAKPDKGISNRHYSAGIVLGGFVSYNNKDDSGYFNSAADRFIETSLLYKRGVINRIIIAAGNGYITKHEFKEAEFIKTRFIELGIPEDLILTDPNSRNTLENAIDSKRIIDSIHLSPPFLLISSALHLPRAKIAFNKKGIPVDLYPCDYSSKGIGNNVLEDVLLPSAEALNDWNNLIKEWLGIMIYKIT
jgi:Uncharacterized conserved protein